MKTYEVTAQARNRSTNEIVSDQRTETVNTTNTLFTECENPQRIKQVYESFWNDLNPHSAEIVEVLSVE